MFRKAFRWFRSLFRPKWHHVNVRYDGGTSKVQFYVDGELATAFPARDEPQSFSFWLK